MGTGTPLVLGFSEPPKSPALDRNTGRVWVKPSKLDPPVVDQGRALYVAIMWSTVSSVWGAAPLAAAADICDAAVTNKIVSQP